MVLYHHLTSFFSLCSVQIQRASRICWLICSASPCTATSSISAVKSKPKCRIWEESLWCLGWVFIFTNRVKRLCIWDERTLLSEVQWNNLIFTSTRLVHHSSFIFLFMVDSSRLHSVLIYSSCLLIDFFYLVSCNSLTLITWPHTLWRLYLD